MSSFTAVRRDQLARALQLPVGALEVLDVGWAPAQQLELQLHKRAPLWHEGGFTFPERNAQGELIGVNLRYPTPAADGSTVRRHLGRRGLTLPRQWRELPDPLLVVEGPTDVLAGRLVGLNVIGRPSNNGGVPLLLEACRGRAVTILGENDRKSDGRWPGRDGAYHVAAQLLSAGVCKPHVAFPPRELKDLRAWVIAKLQNSANTLETHHAS